MKCHNFLVQNIKNKKKSYNNINGSIVIKDLDKELIFYDSTINIIDKLAAFKCKKCFKYKDLTKEFLSDPAFLKFADFILKKSKGVYFNITKFNNLWYSEAAGLISNGKYKLNIGKQFDMLQFNTDGIQKKYLTIINIKEQILQQAIAILLEMIYEKNQSNSKSLKWQINSHEVLHQIKFTWTSLPYYIELKLGQLFKKIHCRVLINILKKNISDKRFLDLIFRMYNSSLWCPDGFYLEINNKRIQSNLFSITLCNLFLNELDLFIKQKMVAFQSDLTIKNLVTKRPPSLYIPSHLNNKIKSRNKKIGMGFVKKKKIRIK